MAASPPISPVVATPLGHRKRRHSEMNRECIDLTGDNDDVAKSDRVTNGANQVQAANGIIEEGLHEDDEDDEEDNQSLVEDLLDEAEIEPYKPDGKCIVQMRCVHHSNQLKSKATTRIYSTKTQLHNSVPAS